MENKALNVLIKNNPEIEKKMADNMIGWLGKIMIKETPEQRQKRIDFDKLQKAFASANLEEVKRIVPSLVAVTDINRLHSFPLHRALYVKKISLPIVQYLLQVGADPNAKEGISEYTPLHYAAIHPNGLPFVKLLVEHGADVNNKQNPIGVTPLHMAILSSNLNTVKFLVEQGAKPSEKIIGNSPLVLISPKNKTIQPYLESLTQTHTQRKRVNRRQSASKKNK